MYVSCSLLESPGFHLCCVVLQHLCTVQSHRFEGNERLFSLECFVVGLFCFSWKHVQSCDLENWLHVRNQAILNI